MTVIKLQDGKYEIERDENGLMVGMWRNGEFWKSGLELFAHAQVFHAALDEIERLRAPVVNLDAQFMNELREAISKSPRYPHDLPMHIGDVLHDIKEWLASPTDSSLAALRDMLRAEVDRLIAGSATPAADLERAHNEGFVKSSRICGQQIEATQAAFNAAIDFAIEQGLEASTFLRAWREGDTSEWPNFVSHG